MSLFIEKDEDYEDEFCDGTSPFFPEYDDENEDFLEEIVESMTR